MKRKPATKKQPTLTTADRRAYGAVRTYLLALRDDPEERKLTTIQRVAREYDMPVKDLRAFRDGNDAALNKLLIRQWNAVLGQDGQIVQGAIGPIDREWYQQMIEEQLERGRRIDLLRRIERARSEAAAALDSYAEVVITGSALEDNTSGGGFEPQYDGNDKATQDMLSEMARHVNNYVLPDDEKLLLVRDACRDGENFEQLVLGQVKGAQQVVRLVNMPTKTMFFNRLPDGTIPPDQAFKQVLPDQTEPTAYFPAWKIMHTANRKSRSTPYGTGIYDSGILAYIKVAACEDSMVIRRLERAPFRLKHTIDVGHCNTQDEIKRAVNDFKQSHRKLRTIDKQGRHDLTKINMPPEEDVIVAKRSKDSPADVDGLEGDQALGDIGDFNHLFATWLASLSVPKTHLGYEPVGGSSRGMVNDQSIFFARKGRRIQCHFIRGLTQLYWVNLILRGIDPRSVDFVIWPSAMNTKDEQLRAQIMLLHSQAVANLAKAFSTTGKQPSIGWMLKYVMAFDDQVVQDLQLDQVIQPQTGADGGGGGGGAGGGGTNRKESDEEMAEYIRRLADPQLAELQRAVTFQIRERAVAMRQPQHMGEENRRLILARVDPFRDFDFAEVARSLGRTELREIARA